MSDRNSIVKPVVLAAAGVLALAAIGAVVVMRTGLTLPNVTLPTLPFGKAKE